MKKTVGTRSSGRKGKAAFGKAYSMRSIRNVSSSINAIKRKASRKANSASRKDFPSRKPSSNHSKDPKKPLKQKTGLQKSYAKSGRGKPVGANSSMASSSGAKKHSLSKNKPDISPRAQKPSVLPELGRKYAAHKVMQENVAQIRSKQREIKPVQMDIESQHPIMNHVQQLMVGTLHEPKQKSSAIVIFAHGFMSSRNHPVIRSCATTTARSGVAAYRFDFSGNGDSEGRFEDSTPSKQIQELGIVVRHFRKEYSKVIIAGHSLGGALAASLAAVGGVDGLITISAPSHHECINSILNQKQQEQIASVGFTILKIRRNDIEIPYTITAGFVEDLNSINLLSLATYINCPALTAHGSSDQVVSVENSHDLYEKIGSKDKELLIIGGADHNFTNPNHQDSLVLGVLEWIKKHK